MYTMSSYARFIQSAGVLPPDWLLCDHVTQVCVLPAGVPASQLHRYGGLGCIDVAAALQPLDFILPPKEAPPPPSEVDVTAELGSLTFDPYLEDPDPAPSQSSPTEPEPAAGLRRDEAEGREEELPE